MGEEATRGRICNRCNAWRDATHFSALKGGVNGLHPKCNECRATISRERFRDDPVYREERKRASQREWQKKSAALEPGRQAKRAEYERVTAEMYALYQTGLIGDEVGARFGQCGSTVRQRFRRAGLAVRPKSETSKPWLAVAIAEYHAGETVAALARVNGVTPTTMLRALRINGVTIRRGRAGRVSTSEWCDINADPVVLTFLTTRQIAAPGRGHWDMDAILAAKEAYNAAIAREIENASFGRVAA